MFLRRPISDTDITKAVAITDHTLYLYNLGLSPPQYELLIQLLNNKPSIKCLDLRHCQINAEACNALAKSEHLRRLHIHITSDTLDDKSAAALAGNKNIRDLSIECDSLTYEGAKVFALNETLNSLKLSHPMTPLRGSCIELTKAFAQNTTLRKLELQGYAITNECAKILASNTTLIELSLPSYPISGTGVRALAGNTTLIKLVLGNYFINEIDAGQFMENTKLQTLSLKYSDGLIKVALDHQFARNKQKSLELEAAFIFKVINIILSHYDTNSSNAFWKKIPWDLILIILEQAAISLSHSSEQTRRMVNLVKDNVTRRDEQKPMWKTMATNGVTLFKITPQCEKLFTNYMNRVAP